MSDSRTELEDRIADIIISYVPPTSIMYQSQPTARELAIGKLMNLCEEIVVDVAMEENRRAGAVWGGLVESDKLNQGIDYMNNRDIELEKSRTKSREGTTNGKN